MYAKTFKLYPFSKRNLATIANYADKLFELADLAEGNGDYEKYEELFSKACRVMNLTSGGAHGYEDINCVWLTGADLAEAKKILASA